ncbi:haloacid dehalogenase type II [Pseudomonas aeruginosa]|uniref:haloacid dehalogenase type II n=1 Tax=Pseudomonas aeruginosa TaxID=287 RepID=UPI0027C292E8|nr:haloacid dehalogenase type II [Pseudomonas aeruginosa]MDQ2578896.1 haloacid dehalogenase type II [Pseudomonas aeruginosa]MDQ2605589.1 haloacid dehalogenase type II [Pseudomonas aeruginosa]MDT8189541.1 haloacid dehalogenase type II [Pseudomonas aeruginosa]MDT8211637.1 haloacid dehalogenase type II [Pseudomonas aeruginosa]HBP6530131.1 haloacid dehalogenase type II [Pseudomonas aeruginosa]
MKNVVAFDIYGTLIDTQAVLARLSELVGDKASLISGTWRQKQLEYSFRRGLMGDYCDFSVCTRQALLYACNAHKVEITEAQAEQAMQAYAVLDAFADVPAALSVLQEKGIRQFAFSNGSRADVERLLESAGIRQYFEAVVSVEAVRSFKPAPAVYTHLLHRCGVTAEGLCLVSSNPFDVLGAAHAGLCTAWLRRDPENLFDPWDRAPDLTIENVGELATRLPELFKKRQGDA